MKNVVLPKIITDLQEQSKIIENGYGEIVSNWWWSAPEDDHADDSDRWEFWQDIYKHANYECSHEFRFLTEDLLSYLTHHGDFDEVLFELFRRPVSRSVNYQMILNMPSIMRDMENQINRLRHAVIGTILDVQDQLVDEDGDDLDGYLNWAGTCHDALMVLLDEFELMVRHMIKIAKAKKAFGLSEQKLVNDFAAQLVAKRDSEWNEVFKETEELIEDCNRRSETQNYVLLDSEKAKYKHYSCSC